MRTRLALAALVVVAAGCASAPAVTLRALNPLTPAATLPPAEAPTVTTAAPTASPAHRARAAVPPSAPPRPSPPIATHEAQLKTLPRPDAVVPVAIATASAISGPVVPTGVDASTGELAVPPDAHVVAWYQYGPSPGDAGSAVLAGHVDWHGVPGIFFELRFLRPGNPVAITMSDGSVRHFTVTAVQLIAKPEVPFADIFSRQGPPTVALVTCGGSFDRSTHHYRSNVLVTAVRVG